MPCLASRCDSARSQLLREARASHVLHVARISPCRPKSVHVLRLHRIRQGTRPSRDVSLRQVRRPKPVRCRHSCAQNVVHCSGRQRVALSPSTSSSLCSTTVRCLRGTSHALARHAATSHRRSPLSATQAAPNAVDDIRGMFHGLEAEAQAHGARVLSFGLVRWES